MSKFSTLLRSLPTKEPLTFTHQQSDEEQSDIKLKELIHNIQSIATERLYKWGNFPFKLPPLPTGLASNFSADLLFVAPTFDELQEVSHHKIIDKQQPFVNHAK